MSWFNKRLSVKQGPYRSSIILTPPSPPLINWRSPATQVFVGAPIALAGFAAAGGVLWTVGLGICWWGRFVCRVIEHKESSEPFGDGLLEGIILPLMVIGVGGYLLYQLFRLFLFTGRKVVGKFVPDLEPKKVTYDTTRQRWNDDDDDDDLIGPGR